MKAGFTIHCHTTVHADYQTRAAERRGRDSNPRTRLTPVTRFPVAPVQPLRHLSERSVRLQPEHAVAQDADLRAVGGDPGDVDALAADHEVDVDDALVDPRAIILGDG